MDLSNQGHLSFLPSEKQTAEDERQNHRGRTRTFPHVAGNWPTIVFVPVDSNLGSLAPETASKIKGIQARVLETLKLAKLVTVASDSWKMEMMEMPELHLSLSRTFTLREHEFAVFVQAMRSSLSHLNAPAFEVDLSETEWYLSDDRSRSFLSLNVNEGTDKNAVCAIIDAVDDAVALLGKPEFYDDPKPHVSLMWCLGDITSNLASANLPLKSPLLEGESLTLPIKTLSCKIGHRIFKFTLAGDI